MKKQLLIVGGGFAGFWSAISAIRQSRDLKKEDELEVTLINLDNYLTIRPRLYEVSLEGLRVELSKYFKPLGIELIIGKAEQIDPENRQVTVSTATGAIQFKYDYLILSAGSALKELNIPGIADSFNVDTFNNAQKLEDHLIRLAKNDFAAEGASTFVVVGSGLTGLEAVTTIKEKAQHLLSTFSTATADFKVILIEKTDKVAGYYAADAQEYVIGTLNTKGIEIITGSYLTAIESGNAVLSNGTRIPTQTVICSVGVMASSLTRFFKGDKDESGRLHVSDYLKLSQYDNVIVAGDVANVPVDTEGHSSIMACQFSMYLGKWAGHNAVNDLFFAPLKAYTNTSYVTCLDLGQNDGLFTTGWNRNLLYQGREGKDIKVAINTQLIYPAEDLEEALASSYPEIPAY